MSAAHQQQVQQWRRLSELTDTLEGMFICPYCYREWTSPNGTGTDICCCGERGHAELYDPEKHDEKE